MSRALASLLLIVSLNVRADWTGWHPSAWTNYRSNVETVGVFATSHSYVLTNYVGTNATITTNAFLSNIYAASNGTSIVSTFSFTLAQTNGALWTNSITTTNRHAATNLILAPREIVCFDLYRAMRERDAALCAAYSAKESVRFYRYERDNLTYAKSWISANMGSFVSTNQPAASFAYWTTNALMTAVGLATDYLAQTPYRALWCGDSNGMAYGFCGITNIFNALIWTKAQGMVENCGGRSNVIASASCESNFAFTASAAGFPLYEARNTTKFIYEGIRVEACWVVPDFVTPAACPTGPPFTGFIPEPPGTCFTITSRWSACDFIPADSNNATCSGTTIDFIWSTYTVTNIITNACDTCENYICSHLAPITFDNCTNRYGTNVVADIEQWFNIGSTGTCAGAGASFTDPFGYGMTVGWTNLFSNTNTIGLASSICNTNFAGTNSIPWQGSTTSTAWAVYDAALIKKWRFQYR